MKKIKSFLTKTKLRSALWLTAICLFIIWSIFGHRYQFTYNKGSSMEPTYSNGDWIVVEKRNYLPKYWIPDRYDVVVIYDGESDDSLSKRVIGIPGDTIEIKHGVLFVNDKKHNDPFSTNENIIVYLDSERELFHNMYVDKITVPEGYVWVIGDNRKISWYGLLPVKDIEGLIIL